MEPINDKEKVTTSTTLAESSTKKLPSEIWNKIFSFLKFNPYQLWQLRCLSKDLKYGINPLEKNSYILISKQEELDKILSIKSLDKLKYIFLEKGKYVLSKKMINSNFEIFGKGIGITIISGGITSHNSRLNFSNLTILDSECGIDSSCDSDWNDKITTPIKLFDCEICDCKTSIISKRCDIELYRCTIRNNQESFQVTDSSIKVYDSEYYHDGKEIKAHHTKDSFYYDKLVEFKNTKLVHKTSPLTSVVHDEMILIFHNNGYRDFEGYERKFAVKSNRPIWQIWLNFGFFLKNRLSFYENNKKMFDIRDEEVGCSYGSETSIINESWDIVTNTSPKDYFLALTYVNKDYFCEIIDNIFHIDVDFTLDHFLFFNQFSNDFIRLILFYINTNDIKDVPSILRTSNYSETDNVKKALRKMDDELFSFLKVFFTNHNFKVYGTGIRTCLCKQEANTSNIDKFRTIKKDDYEYLCPYLMIDDEE